MALGPLLAPVLLTTDPSTGLNIIMNKLIYMLEFHNHPPSQ